jgi:8-oxo-dGTP pyrophosphatase MutT (NUDIX family)
VEPRPAATVVVARASPGPPAGVEVLLLRRSPRNRFAPGFVVFPGGVLDPGDEDLAARWFGDAREAPRACAVRELAEETGLVLTGSGLRDLAPSEKALDAIALDPPARAQLHEVARWVAPEFLTVRFDASFYAVAATAGLDVHPDGVETDLGWWSRPGDVLAEHGLFQTLMWPTYRTLQAIEQCASVEEVLGLRIPQEQPPLRGAGRSPEWHEPAGPPPA